YIFDNYTVGTGATLTIEPGVVCKFTDNTGLSVYKGLLALGGATFDSTIVFTSIKDDYYGGDTNANGSADGPYNYIWRGIIFQSQSLDPLCNLQHCIINHAGYPWGNMQGGVTAFSANPTIQYCSFFNDYWGVNAYGSANPVINYCDFTSIANEAVHNHDQSFVIDAENNWWGDNSGPTHVDNPGGTGEPVSDSVDYDPWLTDGALNPRMGDVSLNGLIQAFDASLILQYTVGNITLNEIQQLAADVSGNGGGDPITAFDASLILQYVVGLISSFPAEELYHDLPARFTDTRLRLEDAAVNQGELISLPVYLENAGGLTALETTLNYDPDLLSLINVEPAGTAAGMYFRFNADEAAGTLRLALAGTQTLPENLQVFTVTFQAAADIIDKVSTSVTIGRFLAQEDDLTEIAKSAEILIQGTPGQFALHPAYPNPFNPVVTLGFSLPEDGVPVRMDVLNMLGQRVVTLLDETKSAGEYTLQWNGTDAAGNNLQSGLYFVRLKAGDYLKIQKIMLIK
ncbi:MAG: T9SS type A sorting domain-containing protein, partial [FCB group bacterium]|nr:T9SS type A sorting domain-containing protein [FCB group bacterium]